MIYTRFSRNRGSDRRGVLSADFWHTAVGRKVPARGSPALVGQDILSLKPEQGCVRCGGLPGASGAPTLPATQPPGTPGPLSGPPPPSPFPPRAHEETEAQEGPDVTGLWETGRGPAQLWARKAPSAQEPGRAPGSGQEAAATRPAAVSSPPGFSARRRPSPENQTRPTARPPRAWRLSAPSLAQPGTRRERLRQAGRQIRRPGVGRVGPGGWLRCFVLFPPPPCGAAPSPPPVSPPRLPAPLG